MKKLILIGLMAINVIAHARGGESVGGGDLCEDRIKIIRDDIKEWILKGGSDELQLPAGISTSDYSQMMTAEIAKAKIECVGLGDPGFPVEINGTPKVCIFEKDAIHSQITCDVNKFNIITESDQYVLIHHEYAGLSEIEIPNGVDSDYQVSNQITGYLQDLVVKKLVVKPQINGDPMEFVKIKAGTFMMGTAVGEVGWFPNALQHKVTLTEDFEIQTTVVTQAQYYKVMGTNPSIFLNCGGNCPVERVGWNRANEFIRTLNKLDKKYNYRLPTEAEWEYAARAGSTTAYWFGNDQKKVVDYAWVSENSQKMTHSVKSKPANPWGLYDMHGNVQQWTADYYGDYLAGDQVNPTGPDHGMNRVLRGGTWGDGARYVGSSARSGAGPENGSPHGGNPGPGGDTGFRLVRTNK